MTDAAAVIDALGLAPHPEGGFFAETYRSDERIPAAALPDRYDGERPLSTSICFMVTAESFSALHRLRSDEIFHFHGGDPAELAVLLPDGTVSTDVLGADVTGGQTPQRVVPRGAWQGVRVSEGGAWSLLGTTVAPGFDFADFEMGDAETLRREFPDAADVISRYTRGTDPA